MFTFREIQEADAKMILCWRTSPRVSKYMKTQVANDLKEQEQWIRTSRYQTNFYHWLIIFQGQPIGYLSLSDYCPISRTTSWGFYIGEEEHKGLGGLVPPFFYNFCFTELGIKQINAEMLYFNTSVIELHRLHGYDFTPKRDRVIINNGKKILLVSMSLQKAHFEAGKFTRFKATFPTSFWSAREQANKESHISFESITGSEEQILYLHHLLASREHTISHENLPNLVTHTEFVKNHPYREWWIIRSNQNSIGSLYLTMENAVGINLMTGHTDLYAQLIEKVRSDHDPLPEIPSVRPKYFFINVSPKNLGLLNGLEKVNAMHTQESYRI
jgi:UDP-4-amino-4,6-dideoxy-N-acetyl-beta-L-altrosamine N-acetyltransferase